MPSHRPPPPRTSIHWPRYLWQSFAFWAVIVHYVPFMVVLLLVARIPLSTSWRLASRRIVTWMVRWWGRAMLRMVGVRLVVEPAAAAELAQKRRRVVTFNHASTMDMMLMSALWPEGAVAVVKREMLWVPLIGQIIYFLDFLPIDRGNRQRATASLRAAADKMRRGDLTVMIAPEGTRSETGGVQAFKLGAFHLAVEAGAPIVPLVLHGTRQLWPRWQKQCNAGVVTVRMLPEQPSGHGGMAEGPAVHASADRLRAMYVAALEQMDGERAAA